MRDTLDALATCICFFGPLWVFISGAAVSGSPLVGLLLSFVFAVVWHKAATRWFSNP